ncbi:MAG: DNA recombination protein RmuC [Pseudomonadota bacterium]
MENLQLHKTLLTVGETALSRLDVLLICISLLALVAFVALISLWRGQVRKFREDEAVRQAERQRAHMAEMQLMEMMQTQNELAGRMAAMQEASGNAQAALSRQMDERLANVTGRVSQSLAETTKNTQESLGKLQERLAVIDTAQGNITSLAANVVDLQNILNNKQARGAFGQSRMEAIVQDGLPLGTFDFQTTLSNGNRPDCTIKMPNDAPSLVIDAKFPLEAWSTFHEATDEAIKKAAAKQFRNDMEVHIKAISEKYLIAGETQETAFLFVPSESIFADIHERFGAIVQRAHKARIVIVSPSLLLLSVQVIQALLKDARMREQAHLIQAEVGKFANDLRLLDDRVRKLQSHFGMTAKDVDQILISTEKLSRHGQRIQAMEFGNAAVEAVAASKGIEGSKAEASEDERGKPFLRAIEGGE